MLSSKVEQDTKLNGQSLNKIVEIIEHELVKHLKAYVCRSGQLVPEKIYLFHSLSNCLPAEELQNVVDMKIRNWKCVAKFWIEVVLINLVKCV